MKWIFTCGIFVVWIVGSLAAPAPRDRPAVVTEWTLQMQGGWRQETTFRSDGTCHSQQFGSGKYTQDGDVIYFSERDDTLHYAILIDWENMKATGGPGNVALTIKLGPKTVE